MLTYCGPSGNLTGFLFAPSLKLSEPATGVGVVSATVAAGPGAFAVGSA